MDIAEKLNGGYLLGPGWMGGDIVPELGFLGAKVMPGGSIQLSEDR